MTPEQLLHDLTNYLAYMNKDENWPEANIRIWEGKLNLIQQAKNEWCKQQRENCMNVIDGTSDAIKNIKYLVKNAPEP